MKPKVLAALIRMALSAAFALPSSQLHAKRLSDWLLEQPPSPENYPLGLSWLVPSERVSQSELRHDILEHLSGRDTEVRQSSETVERFRKWISSLPVTGRVPVAVADARWLQANPSRDPVIRPGDALILPLRPKTVAVVTSDGKICHVNHESGLHAADYIERCGADKGVDWAYIAQPDGSVERNGIALWNSQKQDEPAPGAWIWAPSRDWPERFSESLIAFLATQGPAPDSLALPADPASTISTEILSSPKKPSSLTSLAVTANDWGEAGLLQTPTARMRKAGDFSFTLSRVYPYTRGNVFFQPFSWMEAGFRYTNISNRLYGPVSLSGNQAYKDKSIDVKFNLMDESAYLPQLGLGLRDIAGTGLFSGEFLVGSKRTGPFDWSLGMGWGYVGARGDIPNPIGRLIPAFNTRNSAGVGQGGNFAFSSYFRGPAALFGGVQYQTPWDPLILKLEYDGNNYQREPLNNYLVQSSPWNFGVVYRASDSVDLSMGIERGNTAMFGITLHTAMDGLSVPKLDDPPRVPVVPERPKVSPDWSKTGKDIADQTNWHVGSIAGSGHDVTVTIDDANEIYWHDYLDRAVAVLHRDAPDSVDRFRFVYREDGLPVAEHVVDRQVWTEERTRATAPSEKHQSVTAEPPSDPPETQMQLYENDPQIFEAHLGLNFNYNLGGPNGFILYEIAPDERAKLRLGKDTWLQGDVQYDVLNNFSKFTYDAPSNLPRVRTYLREYMTTSRLNMPNLQLTHVGELGDNQYYSVYGGYLESMFAGVGGEWLYRPFASRTAFGVDLNEVEQRGFAQDFSLRNYSVLTGHGTLYWDTGWQDVLATLSAGRYLAGDIGVTVDLSKVFRNGVRVGAFFTKTNVSAQQFGEGSFDKGIYLSIPFDAFMTKSSDTVGNFLWKPLTRDGGAKLDRAVALYDLTSVRGDRTLIFEPAPQPYYASNPEDGQDDWKPVVRQVAYPQIIPKPTVTQWTSDRPDYEQKLEGDLYAQGFRNIRIALDGSYRLEVSFSSENIRPDSRAVGRAARIILQHAPLETRGILVSFAEHADPVVTYDFFDLPKLRRYFEGEIGEADLKNSVEVKYINPTATESDPLAFLGDMEPVKELKLSELVMPDLRPIPRVERDVVGAARIAAGTDWIETAAIGTGLVLGSSLFDKGANSFALKHASNSLLRNFDAFGNALPWVESAGAALAALGSHDPELSRTGYAASEAIVTSYVLVLGVKYAVGRARPWTGHTNGNFSPFAGSASKGQDSFPSGHAIVSFAALTPFAMEYNMPWLYGLGVITDLSRVGSRNHWVSDTVAGSFLGYGIGKLFWESSRQQGGPHVYLTPYGAGLSWDMP